MIMTAKKFKRLEAELAEKKIISVTYQKGMVPRFPGGKVTVAWEGGAKVISLSTNARIKPTHSLDYWVEQFEALA